MMDSLNYIKLKAYEVGYDNGYVDALKAMATELNNLCLKNNTASVDKDEFLQIIDEYSESIY